MICLSVQTDGPGLRRAATGWFLMSDGCPQLHPAAHLASSGSASENKFIADLHISASINFIWLGGSDFKEEGNWTWTDGTPFTYTNWQDGEGADGPALNCLAVNTESYPSRHGKWYDYE